MKKLNLKEAKCYELERIFFFKINKGIIKVLKVLLKVKKKKKPFTFQSQIRKLRKEI